ncbi:MAG TPA: NlpC/P60 family protein [Frankiaceae bacterium]|nr:NlpC/P60 family protein [Frankiaceae bacterium]
MRGRRLLAAAAGSLIAVGGAAATPPAAAASSLGSRAVAVAGQQAGKPYRYGAAGPGAFDCSGLTQYVYRRLGRHLPRTAAAQYFATQRVAQSHKRPGDLIFFGAPNAYHVTIYAGGDQMWAARHSGTVVQLQRIWTSHYTVGRVR